MVFSPRARTHRRPRPSPSTPASHPAGTAAATLRSRRFAKLLGYYRPHLPLLGAVMACAVLAAATAVALPLSANFVTTHLLAVADSGEAMGQIALAAGLMLGLVVLQQVAGYFVDYQGHMMGAKIESEVRRELFEHCQKLSFSFYDRQLVGQLMSRITNDSLWLGELFHHGPEDLALAALKFGGATVVLALIDPVLTGLIALLMPLAVFHAVYFNRRMNRALLRSKERIAGVNERVEDALGGIRVVQSFANEALEARRFEGENRSFLESRRDGYRSEALVWAGADTFAQIITVVVIVAGALRIRSADLTIADLLTFLLCVGVLIDPIRRLANFARLWQEGQTGFVRAMELLEVAPEIVDRPGAVALARPRGQVTFENVTFGYDGAPSPVLDRFSLAIAPGEFVAIVGASGVGKTTLCALIPRFYDVAAGAVRIDGRDVRDVTLASLRRAIGIVQQDIYLFSGSVAENLRYGRPDASEAEIVAAARAADAHDFITALPQGYDTDIGQRGVRLSGGQKQRLTIARAFLKDPAILIFDEASSALDTDSERAVQRALRVLAGGRTTIVIAHRLSTVRDADRIVVMTEGGIGEEGSHDELVARNGHYARLHRDHGRL